jgi:methionine-rich copper-binding protein CopC
MNKFLGLLLLVPVMAFGHGKLVETIPAADSIVSNPKSVVLRFNQDVRLLKFSVVSEGKKELEASVARYGYHEEHTILVPSMVKGVVTVNWSAIGGDGHGLSESFTFEVRSQHAIAVKRDADTFVDAIVR